MNTAPFCNRRRRVRASVLMLAALLIQQAALASYECPLNEAPDPTPVVMTDCETMVMPDPRAPALCAEHCDPEYSSTPDLRLACPLPALTALYFPFNAALLPPAAARYYSDVPTCASDPPQALRFCSLQI